MRFREESLTFRIAEGTEEFIAEKSRAFRYPAMQKTLGGFKLSIESGSFSDSEIIVMMGENGTGKVSQAMHSQGPTFCLLSSWLTYKDHFLPSSGRRSQA